MKKIKLLDKEYLTPQEVAEILNVKLSTLSVWRSHKINLPYIKKYKEILYDSKDVKNFLDKHFTKVEIKL